jgi:hypothetical protein
VLSRSAWAQPSFFIFSKQIDVEDFRTAASVPLVTEHENGIGFQRYRFFVMLIRVRSGQATHGVPSSRLEDSAE